jgi:hypothetical protein
MRLVSSWLLDNILILIIFIIIINIFNIASVYGHQRAPYEWQQPPDIGYDSLDFNINRSQQQQSFQRSPNDNNAAAVEQKYVNSGQSVLLVCDLPNNNPDGKVKAFTSTFLFFSLINTNLIFFQRFYSISFKPYKNFMIAFK